MTEAGKMIEYVKDVLHKQRRHPFSLHKIYAFVGTENRTPLGHYSRPLDMDCNPFVAIRNLVKEKQRVIWFGRELQHPFSSPWKHYRQEVCRGMETWYTNS